MPQDDIASDPELDAVSGWALGAIAGVIAEELDGPPNLAELLEVIGWSIPSLAGSLDFAGTRVTIAARLDDGERVTPGKASRVGDLGDHVFADATDELTGLADAAARGA